MGVEETNTTIRRKFYCYQPDLLFTILIPRELSYKMSEGQIMATRALELQPWRFLATWTCQILHST